MLDLLHPADLPIGEADFDAVRVGGGFGQDVFDNAAREFAGALVLLEDDGDFHAGVDVFAIVSVGHCGWPL